MLKLEPKLLTLKVKSKIELILYTWKFPCKYLWRNLMFNDELSNRVSIPINKQKEDLFNWSSEFTLSVNMFSSKSKDEIVIFIY